MRTLASMHPDLAREWGSENSKTPHEVSPGSQYLATWVCLYGHGEYQSRVADRTRTTRRPSGCPTCGVLQREATKQAKRLARGSLLTEFPEIAAEWSPDNDKQPSEVTSGSRYLARWVCPVDPEHPTYSAPVKGRTLNGTGCYLYGIEQKNSALRQHWVAKNGTLASTHPELVGEWGSGNQVSPEEVSSSSHFAAWWQCEQGHRYRAQVYNRSRPGTSRLKPPTGCPECNAKNFVSSGERAISTFLNALGIAHLTSVRSIIKGQELDLYVPAHKFAIEFNGLYWHSEAKGRGRDYHAKKQKACEDAGITLYQVWEDDWRDRQDIVVRGIAHRLHALEQAASLYPEAPAYWFQRVGARLTRPVSLSSQEASGFLQAHHIQGFASGSHYLGLVDRSERLRAVLVIKRVSKSRPGEWRIERYATAGIVSGGFTKLLHHAERNLPDLTRWVTFADSSLSDGGLYRDNGFVMDAMLPPDYSYLQSSQRLHKFRYRLKRFRNDPELIWVDGLSERELADINGLYRIWDSGKVRWVRYAQPL